MPSKTAYITGGASGIGLAIANKLHSRGYNIALPDFNISAAQTAVDKLKSSSGSQQCIALETDVRSWQSQVAAFQRAIDAFGRIDVVIVNAGIGERAFVVNDGGKGTGFVEPDMSVLEVDLQGFMYTVSLAVQQMRRQDVGEDGFRGKSKLLARGSLSALADKSQSLAPRPSAASIVYRVSFFSRAKID